MKADVKIRELAQERDKLLAEKALFKKERDGLLQAHEKLVTEDQARGKMLLSLLIAALGQSPAVEFKLTELCASGMEQPFVRLSRENGHQWMDMPRQMVVIPLGERPEKGDYSGNESERSTDVPGALP